MRLLAFVCALVVGFACRTARAADNELGLGLGFALPWGSLEEGSRLSDTTHGIVPVSLDYARRYAPNVSLVVRASYGVVIPKLCASSSDCASSLGHDVIAELGTRFHLPELGAMHPFVDLGFGYEWYRSVLSDQGTTSARSYRGPLFVVLRASADFRLSSVVRIGPSLGGGVGSFTRARLDAPGVSADGPARGAGLHGFFDLGVRTAVVF